MMKVYYIIFVFILAVSIGKSQEITVYNSFESYQNLLQRNNDTTYVINFWATYCAPCIKEMPVFRKIDNQFSDRPLEVILTSLDFGNNARERVRAFMNRHNIQSKVVILDDPDGNSWINKVSPKWSGALPGTLIYNKSEREFYEKTFTYHELKDIVQSKL